MSLATDGVRRRVPPPQACCLGTRIDVEHLDIER